MSAQKERIRLLEDLVECASPTPVIAEALSRFPWDADESLVILTRAHCVSVLNRFLRGELSPSQVESWADALEVRDDIEFESASVGRVVYCLANPVLEGPLTTAGAEELRRCCVEPA